MVAVSDSTPTSSSPKPSSRFVGKTLDLIWGVMLIILGVVLIVLVFAAVIVGRDAFKPSAPEPSISVSTASPSPTSMSIPRPAGATDAEGSGIATGPPTAMPRPTSWIPIQYLSTSAIKQVNQLRFVGEELDQNLRTEGYRVTTEEVDNDLLPVTLRQGWVNTQGTSVYLTLSEEKGPLVTAIVVRNKKNNENYLCPLGGQLPTADPVLVVKNFAGFTPTQLDTNHCTITGR